MTVDDDMDAATLTADLKRLLDAGIPSVEHLRDAHVEAMTRAFVDADAPQQRPRARHRRRRSRVGMAAAAAVLAFATASSALAATGTLPDPVQRAVARVADRVGIHIPRGRAETSKLAGEHAGRGSSRGTTDVDPRPDQPSSAPDSSSTRAQVAPAAPSSARSTPPKHDLPAQSAQADAGRDAASRRPPRSQRPHDTQAPPTTPVRPESKPAQGAQSTTPHTPVPAAATNGQGANASPGAGANRAAD
ncbi:MAG: hypothetical protein H7287_10875 [Thermoleophilia bacterium]|nr:hypothetical protein [Thermoleophilia bacterium]